MGNSRRRATCVSAMLFAACFLPAAQIQAEVIVGADLSTLARLESLGAVFREEGEPRPALQLLRDHGFGAVRLRLWHTPADPWNGLDSTLAAAVRARQAGCRLLLDFHFSDTWADPAHQTKPAAWADLDFPTLRDSLRAYTGAVIARFRDAGALPDAVQLGNEIGGGLLWNDGRVGGAWDTHQQWVRLAQLLAAAQAGIEDSLAADEYPEILLHLEGGGSVQASRWFLDNLLQIGFFPDAIGFSFYPWWHGSLADLAANLDDVAERYGHPVQVLEAAYPWTLDWADDAHNIVGEEDQLLPGYPATPAGQAAYFGALLAVLRAVPDRLGQALYLWEPAWIPVTGFGSPVENLALFDFSGNALPALAVFEGQSAIEGARRAAVPASPVLSLYPNPTNGSWRVAFDLARPSVVRVEVFDLLGRRVAALPPGVFPRGRTVLPLSGRGWPSGAYWVRVGVEGSRPVMRRILLLR